MFILTVTVFVMSSVTVLVMSAVTVLVMSTVTVIVMSTVGVLCQLSLFSLMSICVFYYANCNWVTSNVTIFSVSSHCVICMWTVTTFVMLTVSMSNVTVCNIEYHCGLSLCYNCMGYNNYHSHHVDCFVSKHHYVVVVAVIVCALLPALPSHLQESLTGYSH